MARKTTLSALTLMSRVENATGTLGVDLYHETDPGIYFNPYNDELRYSRAYSVDRVKFIERQSVSGQCWRTGCLSHFNVIFESLKEEE